MSYSLGIDVGTTFTAAATSSESGRAEVLQLGTTVPSMPSIVSVRDDGTVLCGDAAQRRALQHPETVARAFKRRLGDDVPVMVGGTPWPAHLLIAHLYSHVLHATHRLRGDLPANVTVTHPASWGQFKLELLVEATRVAGLPHPALLPEPVAAAMHYSTTERVEDGAVVAVYDLGGGTFDAAVVQRASDTFRILGSAEGIENLGGLDVDEAVFQHVRASLGDRFDDMADDESAMTAAAMLRGACVEAKEALSEDVDATIPVALPSGLTSVRITRGELEAMVRPVLSQTLPAMERAMASAGVTPSDVSRVLLVGGASRMPLIAELVQGAFDRPLAVDAHPKHAVCQGAVISVPAAATPVAVVEAEEAPAPLSPKPVFIPATPVEPEPVAAPVAAALVAEPEPVAAPSDSASAATMPTWLRRWWRLLALLLLAYATQVVPGVEYQSFVSPFAAAVHLLAAFALVGLLVRRDDVSGSLAWGLPVGVMLLVASNELTSSIADDLRMTAFLVIAACALGAPSAVASLLKPPRPKLEGWIAGGLLGGGILLWLVIEDRVVLVNTSQSTPSVVAAAGSFLAAVLASARRTPFQRGLGYLVSAFLPAAMLVFIDGLDLSEAEYPVHPGTLLVSAGVVVCLVLCVRSFLEAVRTRSVTQSLVEA